MASDGYVKISKRGEWPGLYKRKGRQGHTWMVDTLNHLKDPQTGLVKRHKKSFKDKDSAEIYCDKLKARYRNQGVGGFSLSPNQQTDAEAAIRILEPMGMSLREAAEFAIRFRQMPNPDLTVKELVEEFRENKIRLSLSGGKGTAERTLKDYASRHKTLAKAFGDTRVIDFSEKEFHDWLVGRKSQSALIRTTKTLFSLAVERDYIPKNPIRRKTPNAPIRRPPIFSSSEWRRLVLSAIATQDEFPSDKEDYKGARVELLAYVVLSLWCGLRPESELLLLNWEDIHLKDKFVHIDDERTKTQLGRLVTIPDCAIPLLERCRKSEGPIVCPKNFRKRWKWLRDKADVRLLWKPDICRHTFASLHYAHYRGKEKLMSELGHTNPSMLRHYVNLGSERPEEAREFFEFNLPAKT
jgi:integrase